MCCLCVYVCVCVFMNVCLTLFDPMDSNPLGSSVPGILQAIILEWVGIPFSRDQTQVSSIVGRFFTNWATREFLYMCVCVCAYTYVYNWITLLYTWI